MERGRFRTTFAFCAFLALGAAAAQAEEGQHWGYSGAGGPDHWGALSQDFEACSTGAQQSPVDIAGTIEAELPALQIDWKAGPGTIVNNGHSIQVNLPEGSVLKRGEASYQLLQFHFHAPSEHLVGGKPFPMEAHFVHRDEVTGALGVIGVFLQPGADNAAFAALAEAFPAHSGEEGELEAVDPTALLPASQDYWMYEGSLTTPPCSEIVDWMVMAEPVEVSAADIDRFRAIYDGNARPALATNRRFILGPAVAPTPQVVDLVLTGAGRGKRAVIQQLQSMTGMSLRQAMRAVNDVPVTLHQGMPRRDAEEMKSRLEWVGASVELK